MTKERDSQRSKYWKAVAEFRSYPSIKALPKMEDLSRYMRTTFPRAALVSRYGRAVEFLNGRQFVHLRDGRGYASIQPDFPHSILHIPNSARDEFSVLRGLAYLVHWRAKNLRDTGSRTEIRGGPFHGWQYCAILLDMVHFTMGTDAEKALKTAFKNNGVRFTKPVVKKIDPAKKATLVERGKRLAAIRKDQLCRARFIKKYPDAIPDKDGIFDDHYETLYRVFR